MAIVNMFRQNILLIDTNLIEFARKYWKFFLVCLVKRTLYYRGVFFLAYILRFTKGLQNVLARSIL